MKKKTSHTWKKLMACTMVAGILMGAMGCGNGIEEWKLSKMKLSNTTENLTEQYQKEIKDYKEVSVSEEFRQSYADFALNLLNYSSEQTANADTNANIDTNTGAHVNANINTASNTMVSPLSVMMALELTRNGADGETEEQMEQTLYGELDAEEAKQQLMAYLQKLPDRKNAQFHFANSIWLRTGETAFMPKEEFLESSAVAYGAEIYGAPFTEDTRKDVNKWIEKNTNGMIPEMLPNISPQVIMYLINAVAFEAEWEQEYEANQIHDAEFTLSDGSVQTVSMMYGEEGTFLKDEDAVGFLKYYKDGYAFMALLPEEGMDIHAYKEQLMGADLLRILEEAEDTSVQTGIPKFSSETTLELKDALMAMGMEDAFDEEKADFSKMGQSSNGNVCINRVLHKTFVEVDELGTKAGAATVVEMRETGAAIMESVILNRPFLYAIVDTESMLPIFIGIMEQPE